MREGDFAAAIELFEQTIERAPSWADAHFSLGKARREIGDRAGAAAAFRECLRLDPEDTLGASLALAELDAAVTIDMAPAAYVRALFDAYADDFDKALVERLDYSTPQQLAAAIRAARKIEARSGRALDLGCGTGLGGEAIVADVAWLEGVDLSPGMIDKAREKGVYDRLAAGDLIETLHAGGDPYDLILAVDVLIYFGALEKVFAAVARRLAPGGFFAFSLERGGAADYAVQSSLRFAHAPNYVARALAGAGLEIVSAGEAVLRKDRGADVAGLLIVARAPLSAPAAAARGEPPIVNEAPAKLH